MAGLVGLGLIDDTQRFRNCTLMLCHNDQALRWPLLLAFSIAAVDGAYRLVCSLRKLIDLGRPRA